MRSITRLPGRPLRGPDIAELDDSDLRAVPYGGLFEENEIRIYAIKITTGNTAHAQGFDDTQGQWRQFASADASDLEAADDRLDVVLDGWA